MFYFVQFIAALICHMNGLYRKIKEIRKQSDDNWSKMKDVLCRLFRRKS